MICDVKELIIDHFTMIVKAVFHQEILREATFLFFCLSAGIMWNCTDWVGTKNSCKARKKIANGNRIFLINYFLNLQTLSKMTGFLT